MTANAKAELARELGGDLGGLDQLSEEHSADLLALFRAARVEERKDLDKSIDATLAALPWVLRGPAKKVMFGGRK
jgi:hypothetical protein